MADSPIPFACQRSLWMSFSHLSVPSEEIEDLISFANNSRLHKSGVALKECSTYWLPITQQKQENNDEMYSWIHHKFNHPNKKEGKEVKFLPWELGQPNGLEFQQCVVMAPKTQLYYDVDCKETHCFFCSVCKQLHFFLRGLSEGLSSDKVVDNFYLDMNGIIHPCTHGNNQDDIVILDETLMFKKIFGYVDR